jgi:hypothetical protein
MRYNFQSIVCNRDRRTLSLIVGDQHRTRPVITVAKIDQSKHEIDINRLHVGGKRGVNEHESMPDDGKSGTKTVGCCNLILPIRELII